MIFNEHFYNDFNVKRQRMLHNQEIFQKNNSNVTLAASEHYMFVKWLYP
jgi:hypothetical protein